MGETDRALPANISRVPHADGTSGYRGRYRGPDRRRHTTAVFPTISLAQRALEEARGDIARGDWLDPRRSAITLDQWFALWMPDRPRIRPYVLDKDWARYRNHIEPHLGRLPLSELTTLRIQNWMSALPANPATVKKAHALLRTALGKRGAQGDGRIRQNPCELVPPPSVESPAWQLVTRTQFETLLTKIPEQYQTLVLVAAFTGLRWSELCGLHRHHFNPLKATLTVEQGRVYHKGRLIDGPTKSGKPRQIPLTPRVVDALNATLAAQPVDGGPIFRSPRGNNLRHPAFTERVYKPAAVRAGLATWTEKDGRRHYKGVRFHDLRHSCLSWLLNGGMDIHEVKEIGGHATITTTQLYAHTDADELRAAMLKALG